MQVVKEIPRINDEPHILKIVIKNTTGMFTLQEEADGELKVCLKVCFHNDIAAAVASPEPEWVLHQQCIYQKRNINLIIFHRS